MMQLRTNAPLAYLVEERVFALDGIVDLIFESPEDCDDRPVSSRVDGLLAGTSAYWTHWVKTLVLPREWQDESIRAAITLRLNTFEDTGAILDGPAGTRATSPEGEVDDGPNCLIDDAAETSKALRAINATEQMHAFRHFLEGILLRDGESVASRYGLAGKPIVSGQYAGHSSTCVDAILNDGRHDAHRSSLVLALAPYLFDHRVESSLQAALFRRMEHVTERDVIALGLAGGASPSGQRRTLQTQPVAVAHAACSLLSSAAQHLGVSGRARAWCARARVLREAILRCAWKERPGVFAGEFGGPALDARVLRLPALGVVRWEDERFLRSVRVIEGNVTVGGEHCRPIETSGHYMPDGAPFWLCEALANTGRSEEARYLFEKVMSYQPSAIGFPHGPSRWIQLPRTRVLICVLRMAHILSRAWENVTPEPARSEPAALA